MGQYYSTYYATYYATSNSNLEPSLATDQVKPKNYYGYRKDTYDERDLHKLYTVHHSISNNIIKVVDLRDKCPSVYNQGQLGSCTANAICGNYSYIYMQEQNLNKEQEEFFSRLFVYWNERELEGTPNEDSGASLRDGIKVIAKLGVPLEKFWPYDIDKFAEKPSDEAFKMALKHVAIKYHRLSKTKNQLKQCLANGDPFVFGFVVYESFESEETAKTGVMTMPTTNDKVIGGHAVMCVGYDDTKGVWIIRNSWDTTWGDQGYFYMPDEFLFGKSEDPSIGEYTQDFWCIEATKDEAEKNYTTLSWADITSKSANTNAQQYTATCWDNLGERNKNTPDATL